MGWWIAGAVCGVFFLLLLAVGGVIVGLYIIDKRKEQSVLRDGVPLIAWLVQANHNLYQPGNWDLPAQALISFPGPHAASPEQVAELATRMQTLKADGASNDVEAEVVEIAEDEKFQADARTLLPGDFTGGLEVYYAHIWIKRDCLPEGRITLPYLHCKAIPGEKGPVYMLPYPDKAE